MIVSNNNNKEKIMSAKKNKSITKKAVNAKAVCKKSVLVGYKKPKEIPPPCTAKIDRPPIIGKK